MSAVGDSSENKTPVIETSVDEKTEASVDEKSEAIYVDVLMATSDGEISSTKPVSRSVAEDSVTTSVRVEEVESSGDPSDSEDSAYLPEEDGTTVTDSSQGVRPDDRGQVTGHKRRRVRRTMFTPVDFRGRSRKVRQRAPEAGAVDSRDGGEAEIRESSTQTEPKDPLWPIRLNDDWSVQRIKETFSEDTFNALVRAADMVGKDIEKIH